MKQCRQTILILLGALLSGCASVVPQFDIPLDEQRQPTVRSIVNRVKCELFEVVEAHADNAFLLNANDVEVAVELNLAVTQEGGIAPTFTYMEPSFSFGSGFTLNQSREQSITIKLYYSIRVLMDEIGIARKRNETPGRCDARDTNLAGNLGIKQSVDVALSSSSALNWDGTGTYGAFGGYVNFIVKKELNATGPTWSLSRFKGPGAFGSLSEHNTDKLVFAFVKGKRAAKSSLDLAAALRREGDNFISSINNNQLNTQLGQIRSSIQ